ncbi:MAG: hypothetical protein ACYTGL_14945 [Planctomycetota bacterium]|jgi:hypothetical protein
MAVRRSVADVLGRLAESEGRFLESEVLAPVVRGHRIQVRIEGVVCALRADPNSFEGWGVFRPQSLSSARLIREATLQERRAYLERWPLLRMILCRRSNGWLALPAEAHSKIIIEGTPPVRLVESGELFQTVRVRFDGVTFWFDGVETRQDPTLAGWLRESLERAIPAEQLHRSRLTSPMRRAYALELKRREQAVKVERHDRIEGQLRRSLAHSGARLQGFVEHADGYRVTWLSGGRQHVSSIDRDDLTVQVAGICLNGEDRNFDLGSLVGVVREAEQLHEVVEIGHANGGMDEHDYFRIHPRNQ